MRNEFSNRLKIKLVGRSLLNVAIFTSIWIGILLVLISNAGIEDMIRALLKLLFGFRSYYILIMLQVMYVLIFIAGIIMLTYKPVIKSIDYLQKLVDSVDKLFQKDDAYIQLPEDLHLVGEQLNALKQNAIKNERTAKQAERRKNDLVVYLAHDIKTPLTSIIGYLNLLNEAPDLPLEQRAKYVDITLDKAYRLEGLVNEFFEITRFNLQSIVLNKGRINLPLMLQQMADEFYPLLAPQGKQVVVHAPDDLFLFGDADKLSRVFNNILKNAVSYSYESSIITISAFQQRESIVITFSNQGETIFPEKLSTIFDRFFRLDASRSSHTGGAGLGLAIAKEIVSAHGGGITAESSEEKTVFTVTLPDANKKTST